MTKKLTVGETIEKVNRLQLKQGVMDVLAEYLAQFIPTDSYEPSKGLSTQVSAAVVPQDMIEEVRDEILATKASIEKKIKGLKGQSIVVTTRATKKAPTKKKVVEKSLVKRPPPKRRTNAKRK